MSEKRILPPSYDEIKADLGDQCDGFDELFAQAIGYFDSLLDSDAKSLPAMEKDFTDKFRVLLDRHGYLVPRNLRECLIKLSYGYFMRMKETKSASNP